MASEKISCPSGGVPKIKTYDEIKNRTENTKDGAPRPCAGARVSLASDGAPGGSQVPQCEYSGVQWPCPGPKVPGVMGKNETPVLSACIVATSTDEACAPAYHLSFIILNRDSNPRPA